MKIDAPCPECDQTPVDVMAMADGKVWLCPYCGHIETESVADLDGFVNELGAHDPELIAGWREALGLEPQLSAQSGLEEPQEPPPSGSGTQT